MVVSTGQESSWEVMDGLSDLTVGYFTFFKGKKCKRHGIDVLFHCNGHGG